MAIYSGFSHEKWWFSIAMLNYQRVETRKPNDQEGFWMLLETCLILLHYPANHIPLKNILIILSPQFFDGPRNEEIQSCFTRVAFGVYSTNLPSFTIFPGCPYCPKRKPHAWHLATPTAETLGWPIVKRTKIRCGKSHGTSTMWIHL